MPGTKAIRFIADTPHEPPHPATAATGRPVTAPLAMQSQPRQRGWNRPQPLAWWQ